MRATPVTPYQRGLSLVEMLIYAALLALATSVFVGGEQSARNARLELAVGRVHEALAYAQAESLRSGVAHGVTLAANTSRLRLYREDPVSGAADYAVYHPVTRQLWDVSLDALGGLSGLQVSIGHTFAASCTSPSLLIFRRGTPACDDSNQALLHSGSVTLQFDGMARTISIDGITGRVTS